MPKNWIAAATGLPAWLHQQNLTLADLDQQLLDGWLADGSAQRLHVGRFVAWLERHHTTRGLRVPARPASTAVLALPERQRLAALRRLLRDERVDDRLRIAGCLVGLYAQPTARIVRLTAADLTITPDAARVRLGEPVPLPAPLRDAAARVLMRARIDDRDPWLFPGQKAGQPANPMHLARRLRGLGVPTMSARSSALAALVHRIPAPVLADLLGLHGNHPGERQHPAQDRLRQLRRAPRRCRGRAGAMTPMWIMIAGPTRGSLPRTALARRTARSARRL